MLNPKEIDKFTSYRYYNDDNIKEYYSILLLKKMGFSLNEIKMNKDNLSDELFLSQREKLLKDIIDKKEIIKTIDKIRSSIVDGNIKLDEFNYEINHISTKKMGKNYSNENSSKKEFQIILGDYIDYINWNGKQALNMPIYHEIKEKKCEYYIIYKNEEYYSDVLIFNDNHEDYINLNITRLFNEYREELFDYIKNKYDTLFIECDEEFYKDLDEIRKKCNCLEETKELIENNEGRKFTQTKIKIKL